VELGHPAQRLEVPLPERREEMGRSQQVAPRAHVDRMAVRQLEHRQHALGGDAVVVEAFAHQRRGEALVERGGAAAVGCDARAGAEEAALVRRCGTQPRHPRAAARDVPGDTAHAHAAVPDAAAVARGAPHASGMLQLQVARGHVLARQAVTRRDGGAVCGVPLVDDHQAEGVQQRPPQLGVEPVGMARRDQPHLARQREVEEAHLAAAQPAGGVVDVAAGDRRAERMAAIELPEGRMVHARGFGADAVRL
jgi:hypothetical protein